MIGKTTPKFLMAFMISAALHSAVSMALFVDPQTHFSQRQANMAAVPKNIVLEFVPAPKHIREEKIPQKATVVSDMASVASNPDPILDLPKSNPYQKGEALHSGIERLLIPPSGGMKASVQSSPPAVKPEKPKIRDLLKEMEEKQKPAAPLPETQFKKTEPKLKVPEEIRISSKEKSENLNTSAKKKSPDENEVQNKTSSTPAPKSLPKAPVKRTSPGIPKKSDDFTSAGKRNLASEAEILDEIAYNSLSNAVTKYLAPEFKKIANVWQLKLYSLTDFSGGLFLDVRRTVIAFEIMPSGEVKHLHVVEHDGNEFTQRYPLEAVEQVSLFTRLPPEVISYIRTDGLWVKIEFNYASKKNKKR